MLNSIKESPLYPIVNPRSIAFFGASNNFSAMGTNQFTSLRALGFEGTIYPVHPKEEQVQDLKAYRSVLDLPEVPDLAVLVVPTKIVSEILEECGQKGIKQAIIVSGGFKEIGKDGIDREQELVEIANKYGIRFLGPNCIGVANPHHKLNTTFLRYSGVPGFIGMASQSGSFVTQMFNYLSRLSLGFSTAFSVGNEANVDIVDCMEYLGTCPNTKVIALYIEGIRRGREFVEIARSIIPYKPIVALYVGGSETGRRAGFSHTGALAGPDQLYDGVFHQSGVIRAYSIAELFDICWVLGCLPKPRGARVVIQTHSGGPGAAAADSCGREGLELPALSQETLEKLAPFIPKTGSINNPVDITFTKKPMDYFSDIPKVLLEEDKADILLIYFLVPSLMVKRALERMGLSEDQAIEQSGKMIDAQCKSIARLLETHNKPIVGYTFRSLQEHFIKSLLNHGVPVFPGPERAVRAIKASMQYSDLREKILASTSNG
ncbi:CoA-binding protein [Candidatus Aerophobetes bacterium]|uniref:CoA-binding protein n=1 Tax=Aerophobetes bacterium TaxID=2030807 RepID=A0A523UXH2_UNCAE|nr:MAG: CoA-binding protein [Candidatus Aerophobetes bacterium]